MPYFNPTITLIIIAVYKYSSGAQVTNYSRLITILMHFKDPIISVRSKYVIHTINFSKSNFGCINH